MLVGIIVAYIVIAVLAYIVISVGVSILISQRYVYLPEEFWPKPKFWAILGMSIFWPLTIVYLILQYIIESIIQKFKKED